MVRNDVLALTDMYSDEGYAYAEINPIIDQDAQKLTVNITYNVDKGDPVYFEKILISGNTKTRDKVIRRQLNVYEQELYRGQQLKKGVRNLHRLDYFEDVKVDTVKGSAEDKMVLKVDVKEKPTGAFTVGGGYSSMEDVFVMASISQRNLFGRGQDLTLKAMLGGRSDRYTLSFTEPWLFDIPLSAGFDLYNWTVDWDTYEKQSQGAAVRFSYPVFEYTRAYTSYTYEINDITDVTDQAPRDIKYLIGENVTSKVMAAVAYDSRDRVFNPTEGSDHSLSVEYAGLGGDIAFVRTVAETGWYIPIYKSVVGFIHGKGGYVDEIPGGKLPDYERFYLGGINSLRGFDWRDVHVLDEEGNILGGDKFVQANVELIFPLFQTAGLMGVVFFDTGNVYATSQNVDLSNLRESAGFGIRWYSPLGPIRLENGYILDPRTGESDNGRWQFTMGAAF
jgi:outer membrane protein insertion porin family